MYGIELLNRINYLNVCNKVELLHKYRFKYTSFRLQFEMIISFLHTAVERPNPIPSAAFVLLTLPRFPDNDPLVGRPSSLLPTYNIFTVSSSTEMTL